MRGCVDSQLVIPARAKGANPESRNMHNAQLWIPGSLAPRAPRNDGVERVR